VKRSTAAVLSVLVIAACAGTRLLLDKGPGVASLQVRVEGLEHTDGQMRFALFAGPDGFPSDPALAEKVEIVSIEGSSVIWDAGEFPTGIWAVLVIHDEDGDGEMATDWMGRPSEGWGASNDARGSFGPPSFDDAAFEIDGGGADVVIQLTY
jgi:uncharacterized protein (DUF2141 family)